MFQIISCDLFLILYFKISFWNLFYIFISNKSYQLFYRLLRFYILNKFLKLILYFLYFLNKFYQLFYQALIKLYLTIILLEIQYIQYIEIGIDSFTKIYWLLILHNIGITYNNTPPLNFACFIEDYRIKVIEQLW